MILATQYETKISSVGCKTSRTVIREATHLGTESIKVWMGPQKWLSILCQLFPTVHLPKHDGSCACIWCLITSKTCSIVERSGQNGGPGNTCTSYGTSWLMSEECNRVLFYLKRTFGHPQHPKEEECHLYQHIIHVWMCHHSALSTNQR
ncbi:hypothetical protein TNCV_4934051 [Trichonephila clavipes]|nr:hypothetical protein TNCV_4934051 [Trichonephila clavipes]